MTALSTNTEGVPRPAMARARELHHVAMSVADIERSIHFYGEGLGLRKTLDMEVGNETTWRGLRIAPGSKGRAVYFQGPRRVGQIELIQWNITAPEGSRPKRPGDPGVFSLSFDVERSAIDEIHTRLVSMGIECYTPPETNILQNYGPITRFLCEDPDRVMVEIISLPTDEEVARFRSARSSSSSPSQRH